MSVFSSSQFVFYLYRNKKALAQAEFEYTSSHPGFEEEAYAVPLFIDAVILCFVLFVSFFCLSFSLSDSLFIYFSFAPFPEEKVNKIMKCVLNPMQKSRTNNKNTTI